MITSSRAPEMAGAAAQRRALAARRAAEAVRRERRCIVGDGDVDDSAELGENVCGGEEASASRVYGGDGRGL